MGEAFTLAGEAMFDYGELAPYLAERYGIGYVDARIPRRMYYAFDLTKIKTLLGFKPEYDTKRVLDTAEAIHRGEDTDVIPTGVRWTNGRINK